MTTKEAFQSLLFSCHVILPLPRIRWILRAIRGQFFVVSSHSQMRITRQFWPRRVRFTIRSRILFLSSLLSHHSVPTLRYGGVFRYWASMPKAAVDKNGNSFAAKEKVWVAENPLMTPPSRNSMNTQELRQHHFSTFVTMCSNPGHDLGTLCTCENIAHKLKRRTVRIGREASKSAPSGEHFINNPRNLVCQQGRNRIADLMVLLCAWPFKEIVVGKCLKSRCFANRKASALYRIVVDIVVAVF